MWEPVMASTRITPSMNASMPIIGPYGRGRYHAAVAMTGGCCAHDQEVDAEGGDATRYQLDEQRARQVASENSATHASPLAAGATRSPTATTSTVARATSR
jgi:hypothetical protein